ncbi:hypothetical protein [Telmatospirillum sp.]|uniref:hypothetical protein n=1 Tax=Telmatospirillum sp. TaxID=2079197 RepID=UPI00284A09ED|nr:hypothetical protein [Telmatospirillum sp.]MDR3435124.1 hypothetical protein [Telmatospirillum sp.]
MMITKEKRFYVFLSLLLTVQLLCGCGVTVAPITSSSSETLGENFLAIRSGFTNSTVVALRSEEQDGKLKVCGLLYYYGNRYDEKYAKLSFEFDRLNQVGKYIEYNVNGSESKLYVETRIFKQYYSDVVEKYQTEMGDMRRSPKLDKYIQDAHLSERVANCFVLDAPWQNGFETRSSVRIFEEKGQYGAAPYTIMYRSR